MPTATTDYRTAPIGEIANSQPVPLNTFISYAREDRKIAEALADMLKKAFGNQIDVFLDTMSIPSGDDLNRNIESRLRRADVLILVSTGVLRGSHSWGGFELGFFEGCRTRTLNDSSIRGKVITLCSSGAVPDPVKNRKYIPLTIDSDLVNETEQNIRARLVVKDHDPLVMFLGELLFAITEERLSGRKDIRDDFTEKVRQFQTAVYSEFKYRIKGIRKPQKQLLVRYSSKHVDSTRAELPADAILTSLEDALEVFGIAHDDSALADTDAKELPLLDLRRPGCVKAKKLSWQQFQDTVKRNPLAPHWCSLLSKVVLGSAARNVNVDHSQVLVSHDKSRRFRMVLTTSTTFYDGQVEASVYFVECPPDPDMGREDTTLLLKGIQIVCRYRFLFLEPQSAFHAINAGNWKPALAPAYAQQLLSELDQLQMQAEQAQLDKPGAWARFIPLDELKQMMDSWGPIETGVRKLCAKLITSTGNDAEIVQSIVALRSQLEVLHQETTPHNTRLLRSMSVKLAELAEE